MSWVHENSYLWACPIFVSPPLVLPEVVRRGLGQGACGVRAWGARGIRGVAWFVAPSREALIDRGMRIGKCEASAASCLLGSQGFLRGPP